MRTKGQITIEPLFSPWPKTLLRERGLPLLAPGGKDPVRAATSSSESQGLSALGSACVMEFVKTS